MLEFGSDQSGSALDVDRRTDERNESSKSNSVGRRELAVWRLVAAYASTDGRVTQRRAHLNVRLARQDPVLGLRRRLVARHLYLRDIQLDLLTGWRANHRVALVARVHAGDGLLDETKIIRHLTHTGFVCQSPVAVSCAPHEAGAAMQFN